MAVFTRETDYPSETDNPYNNNNNNNNNIIIVIVIVIKYKTSLNSASKLTDEQIGKVRRIVHQKLKPFHFQIKSYCLSGANYPTDNPSLV